MKIKRRQILRSIATGIAASTLPGWAGGFHNETRIGVVGGGIIGASIAFHLARMGAQVTLFEKEGPAAGATKGSLAWINTTAADEHYATLRMQSMFAWRTLDKQLPLDVTWGGMVLWSGDGGAGGYDDILDLVGKSFDQAAYPKHVIGAQQLAAITPNLVIPEDLESALHVPLDGHVDPVHCTEVFLEGAKQFGANILHPYEIEQLEFDGTKLISATTNRGSFELDKIVLAGGTDTPKLAALVGHDITMLHEPGIMAHSKPIAPFTQLVALDASGVSVKQLADGRIVATDAADPPEHELRVHEEIRRQRVEMPAEIAELHGNRILSKVADVFPVTKGAELDRVIVGYRPVPEDGLPVIGALASAPDVYVATMHSGMTLAPIVGQYVTRELLADRPVQMLEPYRPGRFE